MNLMNFRTVLRAGGLFLALVSPLLLAGCGGLSLAYNDPNVPANERYFNTVGAHPINATGAHATGTAAAETLNPVVVQPRPPGVSSNAPTGPGVLGSSKLGVGDLLTVNFTDLPPNSGMPAEQEHRIGDDGLITLPFNVQIQAAGKTPTQLQKEIRDAYVPYLFVNLTPTVKAKDRYVYVDGEVKVPNRQFHIDGLTVLRVISTAGGFTDFANKKKIEVRRAIGGKVETVDWTKARKNPKFDLPLYVNDQVYVPRGIF
jgi:polysaccharide export outer membrane protein